jgi:hypothetical protein
VASFRERGHVCVRGLADAEEIAAVRLGGLAPGEPANAESNPVLYSTADARR